MKYSITDQSIENYTETQYNNFGWVRANDVISAEEYTTLLSRFADFKHNKDKYPVTRFVDAVIHSTEAPGILMYVKGTIKNPHISKIVKINYFDTLEIQEEILYNERRHLSQPYESIESFYGEEIFTVDKARNYASFQEYRAKQERRNGEKANTYSGAEQNRGRSTSENQANDGVSYSLPVLDTEYLSAVENGDMETAQRLVDEAAKENGYTISKGLTRQSSVPIR